MKLFAKQWLQTKNSWYLYFKQKLQCTLAVAFLRTSPADSALGQWSFRSWAEIIPKHGELVPPLVLWVQELCFHAHCQTQPWVGCLPTGGASTLLPWTDPSSAWPLSAATALSLGGEESGQCWGVLWQGWCHLHLLCLRVAAPLTALVTSCRVLLSEALQTILPPWRHHWHVHMGFSISMQWQLLSAQKQKVRMRD